MKKKKKLKDTKRKLLICKFTIYKIIDKFI